MSVVLCACLLFSSLRASALLCFCACVRLLAFCSASFLGACRSLSFSLSCPLLACFLVLLLFYLCCFVPGEFQPGEGSTRCITCSKGSEPDASRTACPTCKQGGHQNKGNKT